MSRWWLARLAVLLSVTAASSLLATGQAPPPGGTNAVAEHQLVFKQYCLTCHNDQLKTAGLSLAAMDVGRIEDHPEVWEKVVFKLRARFMPPSGRPRPDEATYDRLVTYLETA